MLALPGTTHTHTHTDIHTCTCTSHPGAECTGGRPKAGAPPGGWTPSSACAGGAHARDRV
eukprot:1160209-Pelagomonas_calceolata.AAC.4